MKRLIMLVIGLTRPYSPKHLEPKSRSRLGFCPGGAIAENCEFFANFFAPSLSSMPSFDDVSHHANGQRGGKACSRTMEVRTP